MQPINSSSTSYTPRVPRNSYFPTYPPEPSSVPSSNCYGELSKINMDCTKLAAMEAGIILALVLIIIACAINRLSCRVACARRENRPLPPEPLSDRVRFSFTSVGSADSDDEDIENLSICPTQLSNEIIDREVEMINRDNRPLTSPNKTFLALLQGLENDEELEKQHQKDSDDEDIPSHVERLGYDKK